MFSMPSIAGSRALRIAALLPRRTRRIPLYQPLHLYALLYGIVKPKRQKRRILQRLSALHSSVDKAPRRTQRRKRLPPRRLITQHAEKHLRAPQIRRRLNLGYADNRRKPRVIHIIRDNAAYLIPRNRIHPLHPAPRILMPISINHIPDIISSKPVPLRQNLRPSRALKTPSLRRPYEPIRNSTLPPPYAKLYSDTYDTFIV